MRRASIVAALLATSCSNPKYCADQPGSQCSNGDASSGSGDASTACTADSSCAGATPVCDLVTKACVACTTADNMCPAMTPVCHADDVCHGCAAHSECPSNACLPDGTCGDDTNVAYVDPNGSGSACTKAMPCNHVSVGLATNRANVKISGTIDEAVTLTNRNVTFLADPSARLQSTGNTVMSISGTSDVRIFDLSVGPSGSTYQGIVLHSSTTKVALTRVHLEQNKNGGVIVDAGELDVTASRVADNTGAGGIYLLGDSGSCTLNVRGTTLTNNSGGAAIAIQACTVSVATSTFTSNVNGGISVTSSPFTIVGNMFLSNGASNSNAGGILINTSQNVANRLEFNTFVKNQSLNTVGPAIQCDAGTFTARNNIMDLNVGNGGTAQYAGSCNHAHSIATPGVVPTGSGNLGSDPMFADLTGGNLHLTSASPARGAADPASDLTGVAATDIDGDMRVAPADIGADQYKP